MDIDSILTSRNLFILIAVISAILLILFYVWIVKSIFDLQSEVSALNDKKMTNSLP